MKHLGRLIAKTNIGKQKRGFKPPMKSESVLRIMFQEGGTKAAYNLRADDTTQTLNSSSSNSDDDPPPGGGDSIDWVVEPSLYTSEDSSEEARYLPEETEGSAEQDDDLSYTALLPYLREPEMTAVSAVEETPDEVVLVYEMARKTRTVIHYRTLKFETAPLTDDPFRPKTAYLGISQEMDILALKITEVEGL